MHKSQWRTVITVLALALVLLAGYLVTVKTGSAIGATAFPHFAFAIVALAGFVATKALGQHLAGSGGGVKGALSALFTSAKPEGESAPAPEVKS